MQVRYRPYNNILQSSKKFIKKHVPNSQKVQTEDDDIIEPTTTLKNEHSMQLALQPEVVYGFNLPRIRIKSDLTINPEKTKTQLSENNELTDS